jgi:tetratricopeptide (TPR) repeat protein
LLLASLPCGAQTEAEKLIEAGHWKQARALVDPKRSQDALTQFLLSQIHNAFGDRDSPLPLAEKAAALDGKVAKYHRQIAEVTGVMAQHANMFQEFMLGRRFKREIDTALSLDPRDLQALRDLMEFYLLAPAIIGGDKEKARATANRIAQVDPVQGYLAQARLAEADGDRSRQEAMLRRAVEAGPPQYGAHYRALIALASFLLSRGKWDDARQYADSAMKMDGNRVDAYSILAAVYAHRGQTADLESILAVAEKHVPDDLSPYYQAGEVLFTRGQDLPRAELYFRRYLSVEPEGNAPTSAEARGKLQQAQEKAKGVSGTRAVPGPG